MSSVEYCIGDCVRPEDLEYFVKASVLKNFKPVVDSLSFSRILIHKGGY